MTSVLGVNPVRSKELRHVPQGTQNGASVLQTIREVVDSTATEKVFGSPISRDGITVVPVAKVSGGGGGGSSAEGTADAAGSGGGMGMSAKPLGVFVIRGGNVGWRPAVDVNKVIIGVQIVAVIALLTVRALIKARAKRNSSQDEMQ
jgi:uncharacterized spore protein YtfJ